MVAIFLSPYGRYGSACRQCCYAPRSTTGSEGGLQLEPAQLRQQDDWSSAHHQTGCELGQGVLAQQPARPDHHGYQGKGPEPGGCAKGIRPEHCSVGDGGCMVADEPEIVDQPERCQAEGAAGGHRPQEG